MTAELLPLAERAGELVAMLRAFAEEAGPAWDAVTADLVDRFPALDDLRFDAECNAVPGYWSVGNLVETIREILPQFELDLAS